MHIQSPSRHCFALLSDENRSIKILITRALVEVHTMIRCVLDRDLQAHKKPKYPSKWSIYMVCTCKKRNPVKSLPFSKQCRCSYLLWKLHGHLQIRSNTWTYIQVGSIGSGIRVSTGPYHLLITWVWLQLPICLNIQRRGKTKLCMLNLG